MNAEMNVRHHQTYSVFIKINNAAGMRKNITRILWKRLSSLKLTFLVALYSSHFIKKVSVSLVCCHALLLRAWFSSPSPFLPCMPRHLSWLQIILFWASGLVETAEDSFAPPSLHLSLQHTDTHSRKWRIAGVHQPPILPFLHHHHKLHHGD